MGAIKQKRPTNASLQQLSFTSLLLITFTLSVANHFHLLYLVSLSHSYIWEERAHKGLFGTAWFHMTAAHFHFLNLVFTFYIVY